MESPTPLTTWFFFDSRVPEREVMVPIRNRHGLAFAVRPGATPEEIIDALNTTSEFVLRIGLVSLGQTEQQKPPDVAGKG
ncbi:hypothetical protein [Streptomyces cinereospinus]|uniref:Uncharacterized protein n=1 Tax=Streptomyces cinereospinus TaxID=285561 RepID=A0ABV5N2H5_9ACTN